MQYGFTSTHRVAKLRIALGECERCSEARSNPESVVSLDMDFNAFTAFTTLIGAIPIYVQLSFSASTSSLSSLLLPKEYRVGVC